MPAKRQLEERIQVRRLDAVIGVEAKGIDLSQPLSETVFVALRDALRNNSILLIRGQSLSPPLMAKVMMRFGRLRRYKPLQPRSKDHAERYLCEDEPNIMRIGNLQVNGKPKSMFTNTSCDWHIDDLYKAHPHEATALFAVQTPSSGCDTLFTGLRAAYDTLEDTKKQEIDHLQCLYSVQRLDTFQRQNDVSRPPIIDETITSNPPVSRPLVRVDPVTRKKGLFFAQEIMPQVQGMSEKCSRVLIAGLANHATNARFQYRHKWADGDFLIWDNLSTMHRATEFSAGGKQRLLYRAMVSRML